MKLFYAVYADPPAGDPPVGDPPKPPPKTFTQQEVDSFLAADRKKHETKVQDAVKQLEEMKRIKGLSDQERANLQAKIDEMNSSLLTKEEQSKREMEKKDKEYKTALESRTKESDQWRGMYAEESTRNQIIFAATEHEAVSVEQVQDLLMPKTRIVEILDSEGKPTGRYIPKVKMHDKDKEGKTIELDLTVSEAIKRMKDNPERFGNLFKSGVQGGLGGGRGGAAGGGGESGEPPTDPEAYREWRKKHKIGRK